MKKALGVVNCTPERVGDAHESLTALAGKHGWRIVDVLAVTPDTYMPTTLITYTAARTGAKAIVAPGLDHLVVSPNALRLHLAVITPDAVLPCTSR